MTTHRLPVKTRAVLAFRNGLWTLLHALPDAIGALRAWYRDDRVGPKVDNVILILVMLTVVFGSGIGAVWFFMKFAG